jgi:hypothetical protein
MSRGKEVADALQARLDALMDKPRVETPSAAQMESRLREMRDNSSAMRSIESAAVRDMARKTEEALQAQLAAARHASEGKADADALLVQIADEMALSGDNRAARTALSAAGLGSDTRPCVASVSGDATEFPAAPSAAAGEVSVPVLDDALLERLAAEERRASGLDAATDTSSSAMAGADTADAAAARLIAALENAGFKG